MKIMYAASRGRDEETLLLEREITALQRRANASPGEPIEFQFFPDLPVEDLPLELSLVQPDILHLSAHGDAGVLNMASTSGAPIQLTADRLDKFLHPEKPPLLVYLNACNSHEIARDLIGRVQMAIGSTAPISNRAARNSAVLFYDRIINGATVKQAFEASRTMVEAMNPQTATMILSQISPEVSGRVLHHVPRIVARFTNGNGPRASREKFRFELGIIGCRTDVVQTVFFTDDESYINSDETYEDDLCLVTRNKTAEDGVLWSGHKYWWASGDHRLFVCACTAAGQTFSISATLCQAIEANLRFLELDSANDFAKEFQVALANLRAWDRPETKMRSSGTKKRSPKEKWKPKKMKKTMKTTKFTKKTRKKA